MRKARFARRFSTAVIFAMVATAVAWSQDKNPQHQTPPQKPSTPAESHPAHVQTPPPAPRPQEPPAQPQHNTPYLGEHTVTHPTGTQEGWHPGVGNGIRPETRAPASRTYFLQNQDDPNRRKTKPAPPMPPNQVFERSGFAGAYYDPFAGGILRSHRSRSGVVAYGGSSNGYLGLTPLWIPPPIRQHVVNPDYRRKRWGGVWYGLRVGYIAYTRNFVDDLFSYPFYSFDPDAEQALVVSPWYYYPSLPPYLNADRCIEEPQDQQASLQPLQAATPPETAPPVVTNETPPAVKTDLDQALKDLVSSWQADDGDAIDRLVPKIGTVTVHVEGQNPYTLDAKDFFDLLHDGVEGVKTLSILLDEPKMVANNMAIVAAHHTFSDPWGKERTIDQTYTLTQTESGWVITEFASASYK